MATLKVIRKRIVSVRNTQKITRAMKMVAAAKLRRAQTALYQARPYASQLGEVFRRVTLQMDPETTPLLQIKSDQAPASVMVFTSDRGLCGGFNSNLLRHVQRYLSGDAKVYPGVDLTVLGRKGRDFFRAKKIEVLQEIVGIVDQLKFSKALEMATQVIADYQSGKYASFHLAYNGFKSAISQEIRIKKILPLDLPEEGLGAGVSPVIYEPSVSEIFESLLPRYVASEIYLAMLESQASELGARMSAMENATSNAKDMISLLTLQYNRARQAAITKELMDIVNGAEALK